MRWNLSDPPRSVPLMVKVRLLFGGFTNQFGWFFFGFGMIFVWIFGMQADLTGWLVFGGDLATAPGRIIRVEDTNMTVNEQEIHAIQYSFTVDGVERTGVSYDTGSPSEGANVIVEYPAGDPDAHRIAGMDRSPVPIWAIFVFIFPIVGLCFMVPGVIRGLRGARLLRDGKLAVGKLVDRKATNTQINDQTVYKYTFEFTADDGQVYPVTAKTHRHGVLDGEDPANLPASVEYHGDPEDTVEPLVYDPMDPKRAAILDGLPGGPRIDENGNVRAGGLLGALASLIVPGATVIGHGIYIAHRYF